MSSFALRSRIFPTNRVLLITLVGLTMPSAGLCQSSALSLASGSGQAGSTVTLNLTLSGTATGGRPASFQFNLAANAADFSAITAAAGPVATAAGKSLACSAWTNGVTTCMVWGLNNSTMGDGVAATVSATLSSGSSTAARVIQITQSVASDLMGTHLAITSTGGSVQITVPAVPPAASSLTCNPTTLVSGAAASCTVQLTQAAPSGGVLVSLSRSNSAISVPASVTVPSSARQVTFTATAGTVTNTTSTRITAVAGGATVSSTVSITPLPALSSLTCTPSTVTSGGSTACSVALNRAAPAGGLTVALTDNNTSLSIPASVTIAAGQSAASFTATVAIITTDTSAQLTATLNSNSRSATLTLAAPARLTSLTCTPPTLSSGATSSCTVALSKAAPTGGLSVTLTDNSSSLSSPASVSIPSGQSSAAFTATAGSFTADSSAQLTATLNGSSSSATLTLTAPPQLTSLSCTPSTLNSGSSTSCTVALSKPAPTGGFAISLSSSSSALSLPSSISAAPGSSSATFSATAASVTAIQSVTLTARPPSGSAISASLSIQPAAPLQLTSLTCSPSSITTPGSSTCTVSISSPAPSSGLSLISGSDKPSILSLPSQLTIPPASSSTSFSISASSVSSQSSALVGVGYNGTYKTLSLSLLPPPSSTSFTSFSCSPSSIQPGQLTLCKAIIRSPLSSDVSLPISESSRDFSAPNSVLLRAGQTSVSFLALSIPKAKPGSVSISISLFSSSISTAVSIGSSSSPLLSLPSTITSLDGDPVRFLVSSSDPLDLPLSLSASNLPPGSSFDPSSGLFLWDPASVTQGLHSLSFQASNSQGESSAAVVELKIVSPTPKLHKLLDNARHNSQAPCTPGSLAVASGIGLATSQNAGQVDVIVNGQPMPVTSASSSEIVFQCPELPAGTPLRIEARRGDRLSNPLETVMEHAWPGIFTLDGSPSGQASARWQDTRRFVMTRTPKLDSQPAVRGDEVVIETAGLGLSTEEWAEQLLIEVGGASVHAESVDKLSPGVWGVKVKIPEQAALGEAVPLRMTLRLPDGRTLPSNQVTITIEPRNSEDH